MLEQELETLFPVGCSGLWVRCWAGEQVLRAGRCSAISADGSGAGGKFRVTEQKLDCPGGNPFLYL